MDPKCIVCESPAEPCDLCPSRPRFCPAHMAEHRTNRHSDRPARSVDDALADALAEEGLDPP